MNPEKTTCDQDLSTSTRVYKASDIAQILNISERSAYNLLNSTTEFGVIKLSAKCVRADKETFDLWFERLRSTDF